MNYYVFISEAALHYHSKKGTGPKHRINIDIWHMLKYRLFLLLGLIALSCTQSPESQKEENKAKKATIEDVERGIRVNIEQRVKDGGGYFNFKNDSLDLSLKLVRVHTEYLSVLGPDEFFACVDLATENGDVYDVDFFMKGTSEEMEVTRENIHKLNGKPFYSWKQKEDKTWFTVPVKQSSNELLGVIELIDRFIFSYEIDLPEIAGEARVWIPIPQSDRFQKVEIIEMETPENAELINLDDGENQVLFMDLDREESGKRIKLKYAIERLEKSSYQDDSEPKDFLEPGIHQPVGDRFEEICQEVFLEKMATTPLTKARALYDYIIDNVRYAKQGTYGTGDANYACDVKSGNCTEFHSFFISLSRSAGIPARFAVGAAIPSERNEGKVDGYHCWAEFYAEGKWWPVDISEGNKYTPLATYYFGHHPANRIEFTRGNDLSPNPLPASGPINFLAYPFMEINGEQVFPKTTFSFERVKDES